ncbi:hypothetical protein AK812_SmicGene17016 [Symbiodinium microadriaticum]|uniref:Uncharacterized protein n=1 Tax=Symbiodinium microadriaticum TaxID=2951 RepID=A0A1Q9DYR1_SYMMI|nr:hypothetical protein AK812_SmicGene17016 [Symbiodinium microadriaticum]
MLSDQPLLMLLLEWSGMQCCNTDFGTVHSPVETRIIDHEIAVVVHSAVITAMENSAQWKLALAMLAEMWPQPNVVSFSEVSVQPNTITRNSLTAALVKDGQWQKAYRLIATIPGV